MDFLTKVGHGLMVHKTDILIGTGVTFTIGSLALTVFETIKACDVIENANYELDLVDDDKTISEEDKDIATKRIRKETNIKLAKIYAAPVSLEVAGIVCILAAYKILSNQKAAAIAALSATTAAFEKYRSRVIDKYGVEADYELYNGKSKKKSDDSSDKTDEVSTDDTPIDRNCYTKIFSYETAPKEWKSTRNLNRAFLSYYQKYWNAQLQKKGYITYNEVIESLGFSRKVGDGMTNPFIPNGIGWVSSENVPEGLEGEFDTFIQFVPPLEYDDDVLDVDAVYNDGGYVLRFNCYPIDGLLARRAEAVMSGAH